MKKEKGMNANQSISKKWTSDSYNPFVVLVVVAYILLPTYTPVMMALDSNGPKFFALSLLNILVFLSFLFTGYFHEYPTYLKSFLRRPVIISYLGFLFIALLSFTQSISWPESVLQFSKIFSVFSAIINLSVIFMRDKRFIRAIIIAMSILLLAESLVVFYHILKFTLGEIKEISEIKTVYSNKNILGSALFVKMAFALWLLIYEHGRLKTLGWVSLFAGLLATFFMATRAFYLGTLALIFIFCVIQLSNYIRFRKRSTLHLTGLFLAAVILAFGFFSLVQTKLYPKSNHSRHTQAVVDQLATLEDIEKAGSGRLDGWLWSWKMLYENPWLGVGTGNWKIVELKYEHQQKPGFSLLYKAHNDFLETAAETGIFGFVFYSGILAFSVFSFVYIYRRRKPSEEVQSLLVLASAGTAFYCVDAFFNFPADRTEIQVLLAIFVSVGVASAYWYSKDLLSTVGEANVKVNVHKKTVNRIAIVLLMLIQAGVTGVLYMNVLSLRAQNLVFPEIKGGQLRQSSEKMMDAFPAIPAISAWGESIQVVKSRYLIVDKKYDEAFHLLIHDHSNPYDPRRENFLAWMYEVKNMPDSSMYYLHRADTMKPNHYKYLKNVNIYLVNEGRHAEALTNLQKYLKDNPKNPDAWIDATDIWLRADSLDRAFETIELAKNELPDQIKIAEKRKSVYAEKFQKPFIPLFEKAMQQYNQKKYTEAYHLISEFIGHVNDYAEAYSLRAFTNLFLKNYKACISDADSALLLGKQNPSIINIKGISFLNLGQKDEACMLFKKAKDLGDKSGESNYKKHCDITLQKN